MGFFLIGIVVAAAILILYGIISDEETYIPFTYLAAIAFCLFTGAYAGIAVPAGGYYPAEEYKTYKLVGIFDQNVSNADEDLINFSTNSTEPTYYADGNIIYISANPFSYTYFVKEDSKYGISYAPTTISLDNDITIITEDDCSEPRLILYKAEPKKTFWSFPIGKSKKSYTFYLPKNTHEVLAN